MESQEVKEELVFVLESWAVKMFEEKLDAMILCIVFEWIEDRRSEMRT